MDRARNDRWRRRPLLAAGVRSVVVAAPAGIGFLVTWFLVRFFPPAGDGWELAGFWFVALVVSSSIVYLAHIAMRRLLPLVVLLTLTLVFPDEAPSRLRVARAAMSTATLRAHVQRARTHGVDDEPTRAAEQILALVSAVESHDRGTRGHSERVRVYTDLLADEMGLPEHARDRLRWSALLHDVGKLAVPTHVLNKTGSLDEDEWIVVRGHPDEGARLTQPLRAWLGEWGTAIEQHHERFDGSGYPRGLRAHEISLAGRIVAVTDAFETMTAARPYRRPRTAAKARQELVRCAGTEFDPTVVRAFVGISLARLGLLTGPLSWLAQTPILRGLEVAVGVTGRTAAGAAAVGGALAIGVGPVAPPPEPGTAPAPIVRQVNGDVEAAGDRVSERTAPPIRSEGSEPSTDPAPKPSASDRPSPSPSPSVRLEPAPTEPTDPGPRPEPSPSPSTIFPAPWRPQRAG